MTNSTSYKTKKSKSVRHRFVELFVLIVLSLVLLGKLFFHEETSTLFLTAYGVIVTFILLMTFITAFVVYKDPYEEALKKSNKPTTIKPTFVSCMVAVKNEEVNISRCIDSMLRQTYSTKEIIVVNDASTDNTLQILKEYETAHQIILIDLPINVGKKRALARAMSIAKGDIFAHTDSDSVWASDAIEKMVTIFEAFPDIGAISGHGRALNGDKNLLTKVQDSWMEGQFSIRKAFESVYGAVTCVSGPLAVFRKSAIYNFIPAWENDMFLGQEFKFATDRTMTGFVLGSTSVGNELIRNYRDSIFVKDHNYEIRDWRVVYTKAAKSWTIVPDTFQMMLNQQIRWKKSFIRNIFFTGRFYWRKPLPTSFVYYSHILLVLAGPFITYKHLIYYPLHGDFFSAFIYLAGIIFVGFMLGVAYKLENKDSHKWVYRPIMSLMSTLIFTWLVFYSALTIKKMVWYRS